MYCSQLILSWALVKCIWQRFIVYGQQRIAIVRSFWPLYFLNRWAKSSGIVMVKFIRHNHHNFSAVFYTCFFTGVAQNKNFFVLCHFFSFDENAPEFNPNWHEAGHFPPPCLFWIRLCQLNFYQKFPNFFGDKNWHQLG